MPNRLPRHLRIALWACLLAALANAASCKEKKPEPSLDVEATLQRAELAAAERRRRADAGRPRPSAVASALAKLRDTQLDLVPRTLPSQVLALGRGRLAQLADRELIVRSLPDWKIVAQTALAGDPALIELSNGSLLALGADRLLRLEPGSTRFRESPKVTLLPGRFVYPDLAHAERFWVLHPFSSSLFRYELDADAGGAALGPFFDLPSFDGRVFCVLKDASLLYTTSKSWQRSYSAQRHVPLRGIPADGVVRALPAKRLDQVWLLLRDGTLVLSRLAATLTEVRRVAAGAMPFDAASNDEGLAVLELEQAPSRPRRWRLAVYSHTGERRFSADIPDDGAPGATDDWIAAVTRNKNVALSRHEPWVAVGGPSWLRVWNMQDGSELSTVKQ